MNIRLNDNTSPKFGINKRIKSQKALKNEIIIKKNSNKSKKQNAITNVKINLKPKK